MTSWLLSLSDNSILYAVYIHVRYTHYDRLITPSAYCIYQRLTGIRNKFPAIHLEQRKHVFASFCNAHLQITDYDIII